ncbi:MAG: MGMT family protein [Promethearchaeota archaeon]
MTKICLGTTQVASKRWIALALETQTGKLVACTSSEKSVKEAKKRLKSTLYRLRRLDDLDETYESPQVQLIGSRLAKLLEGKGQPFSLKEISPRNWSSARLVISKNLLQVPRGKVISYGGLAAQSTSSPRGVGSVMRTNPVPWAIPCHRVIHSDGRLGKLGGTISGTKEKARILRAEGVLFNRDGTVNHEEIVS